jgi:hypothetical protein
VFFVPTLGGLLSGAPTSNQPTAVDAKSHRACVVTSRRTSRSFAPWTFRHGGAADGGVVGGFHGPAVACRSPVKSMLLRPQVEVALAVFTISLLSLGYLG